MNDDPSIESLARALRRIEPPPPRAGLERAIVDAFDAERAERPASPRAPRRWIALACAAAAAAALIAVAVRVAKTSESPRRETTALETTALETTASAAAPTPPPTASVDATQLAFARAQNAARLAAMREVLARKPAPAEPLPPAPPRAVGSDLARAAELSGEPKGLVMRLAAARLLEPVDRELAARRYREVLLEEPAGPARSVAEARLRTLLP